LRIGVLDRWGRLEGNTSRRKFKTVKGMEGSFIAAILKLVTALGLAFTLMRGCCHVGAGSMN